MNPNIILISIDTLRADHLSCYGYQRQTTPNIDGLAAEGTIYRQNYSTGVWTPPGHASMLTGLYVPEHGVYGERGLAEEVPTIATVLKDAGYRTAGFVNNSQVGELVGFHKGHDLFVEVWKGVQPKTLFDRAIMAGIRKTRESLGYSDMGARRTNRLFFEWVDGLDRGRPFYSFLHYIEPHNPLAPPRPYKKRFMSGKYRNVDLRKVSKVARNPLVCYVEEMELNNEEVSYVKDLYDGEISYTDSIVGEVVSFLRSRGLYDNTMIIITSDHGEHFGEHGHWSHVASLHKEVLHVPLVIKYPEGTAPPGEVDRYTQLVDIFPTVMGVAGVSGGGTTGVSGVDLLGNEYHEYLFAEWEGRVPFFIAERIRDDVEDGAIETIKTSMIMVQDKRYKYIQASDGGERFYDVSDGDEVLMDESSLSLDVSSALREKLAEYKKRSSDAEGESGYSVDDEIVRNLRSLGYM